MVSMGYEVYQKEGIVFIKHGGKVQRQIPLAEVERLFKSGYRERARCRQLRSIFKKYRDVSGSKEELQKELKEKFGISLVFFGRKDVPYGYMIVDHAHRTVINGARVLATEELLDFATPEQRFAACLYQERCHPLRRADTPVKAVHGGSHRPEQPHPYH